MWVQGMGRGRQHSSARLPHVWDLGGFMAPPEGLEGRLVLLGGCLVAGSAGEAASDAGTRWACLCLLKQPPREGVAPDPGTQQARLALARQAHSQGCPQAGLCWPPETPAAAQASRALKGAARVRMTRLRVGESLQGHHWRCSRPPLLRGCQKPPAERPAPAAAVMMGQPHGPLKRRCL